MFSCGDLHVNWWAKGVVIIYARNRVEEYHYKCEEEYQGYAQRKIQVQCSETPEGKREKDHERGKDREGRSIEIGIPKDFAEGSRWRGGGLDSAAGAT